MGMIDESPRPSDPLRAAIRLHKHETSDLRLGESQKPFDSSPDQASTALATAQSLRERRARNGDGSAASRTQAQEAGVVTQATAMYVTTFIYLWGTSELTCIQRSSTSTHSALSLSWASSDRSSGTSPGVLCVCRPNHE